MRMIFKKIWIALLVGVLMSSCEKAPNYRGNVGNQKDWSAFLMKKN